MKKGGGGGGPILNLPGVRDVLRIKLPINEVYIISLKRWSAASPGRVNTRGRWRWYDALTLNLRHHSTGSLVQRSYTVGQCTSLPYERFLTWNPHFHTDYTPRETSSHDHHVINTERPLASMATDHGQTSTLWRKKISLPYTAPVRSRLVHNIITNDRVSIQYCRMV